MKPFFVFILTITTSLSAFAQTAQQYYSSGTDKSNNQDFNGAIKDYNKAIQLDPNYVDAYFNRATSNLYLEDYVSAIADFNKAIQLKPDFTKAYTNRAIAKMKTNDLKGAIKDFDMVLQLEPGNPSPHFMRGQVKLQIGDTKGGCDDLFKAKDMGDSRAQKYLDQHCGDASSHTNLPKESLRLDWPDAEGWKVASNRTSQGQTMIELLRNNETFDNWTEIGSMMTYPLPQPIPVDTAMQLMYREALKSCPGAKLTFIEKGNKSKNPWIIFKIECGAVSSESQVWNIIEGTSEMYANFRAVKEKSVPENLKNKWVSFFKTATIVNQ